MTETDHELEATGLRLVMAHINRVQRHMTAAIAQLTWRMVHHDQSKLSEEELALVVGKPTFDKYAYMSPEERAAMDSARQAITHHYQHNNHHPEHYTGGVIGMSLISLLEMICDWKAASEMSEGGSFRQSLELNTERFSLSPDLVQIIENTARELDWL